MMLRSHTRAAWCVLPKEHLLGKLAQQRCRIVVSYAAALPPAHAALWPWHLYAPFSAADGLHTSLLNENEM
jgi:hypothetical protein